MRLQNADRHLFLNSLTRSSANQISTFGLYHSNGYFLRFILFVGSWLHFTLCFSPLFTKRPLLLTLFSRQKPSSLFMVLPISLCTLLPLNVSAVLNSATANVIQGSPPYLTFDEGLTRATDTTSLLSLTLSDGTIYNPDNNTSSANEPIKLPIAEQSLNDVTLFIPQGKNTISLSDLIGEPYYHWDDDDGDGQGVNGISATGSLSIKITTGKTHQIVDRQHVLDACDSPYEVVLSSTKGFLKTLYGNPNITDFKESSVTYYVAPKTEKPDVCFVKPNLEFGYGSQPEWDADNGFKVQSSSEPKKNFPRTGFSGAFFDITVAGETAKNVIMATSDDGSITQGGVTMTLTEKDVNVVRVMLTGPNNTSGGGIFTPSTFRIKSSPTNDIYNFSLSKWFIVKPGPGGGYPSVYDYCDSLTGNYRVPSLSEYTNANGKGWTEGLKGQENLYARAIGNGKQRPSTPEDDGKGGLFAEWGHVGKNYYVTSDTETAYYWATELHNLHKSRFVVSAHDGAVTLYSQTNINHRGACVTTASPEQ